MSSTPRLPPEDIRSSEASSVYFHDSDADVIFKSSDNVLFHMHRRNLETQAGAFPPSEFSTNGEIVLLTEDHYTLERLFRYIYPQRHPDIDLLEFDDLYKLSEAAEKYEVFGVIAICKMRMKHLSAEHPIEICNYAARHDYPDILGLAASALLDLPLDQVVKKIIPELVVPWVMYRESWSRTVYNSFVRQWVCGFCRKSRTPPETFYKMWANLGHRRSRVALLKLCDQLDTGFHCPDLSAEVEEATNCPFEPRELFQDDIPTFTYPGMDVEEKMAVE